MRDVKKTPFVELFDARWWQTGLASFSRSETMSDDQEENVFDATAFKLDLGGDCYVKRVSSLLDVFESTEEMSRIYTLGYHDDART